MAMCDYCVRRVSTKDCVGGTEREASADNVRQEQGEDSKPTRVRLSAHENSENEILQRSQDKGAASVERNVRGRNEQNG